MWNPVPIVSRLGNQLLIGIGVVFLIAGTATFVFALVTTWGYAGMIDRAMQVGLLGCAAFGALLVLIARKNLGTRSSRRAEA